MRGPESVPMKYCRSCGFSRLFVTLIVMCLPFLFASAGNRGAVAQDAPIRVAQIPFFDKKPIDVPDEAWFPCSVSVTIVHKWW